MERKVLCLLVILMNVWSANVAFGQFYDDEDQIMFYRSIYESSNSCYTFNFDGNRATDFDEIENGMNQICIKHNEIMNICNTFFDEMEKAMETEEQLVFEQVVVVPINNNDNDSKTADSLSKYL